MNLIFGIKDIRIIFPKEPIMRKQEDTGTLINWSDVPIFY